MLMLDSFEQVHLGAPEESALSLKSAVRYRKSSVRWEALGTVGNIKVTVLADSGIRRLEKYIDLLIHSTNS